MCEKVSFTLEKRKTGNHEWFLRLRDGIIHKVDLDSKQLRELADLLDELTNVVRFPTGMDTSLAVTLSPPDGSKPAEVYKL